LIVHYEDKRTELYNLANDPGEINDVAKDYPAKVKELTSVLNQKLTESNAQFPVKNPDYIPRD
jgi:hypothetical protein